MKRKILTLLICTIFSQSIHAQFDKFIYDLSNKNGNLDFDKLVSLLSIATGSQNIFILSEADHRETSADSIIVLTSEAISKKNGLDFFFFEWVAPDYYSLNLLEKDLKFIDKVWDYNKEVWKIPMLKEDFYSIPNYLTQTFKKFFFQSLPLSIVYPIDFGTIFTQFTIAALAYTTKQLNVNNIKLINDFADSVLRDHAQRFNVNLYSEIADSNYLSFKQSFANFITKLNENDFDSSLIYAWTSLADEFAYKYSQDRISKIDHGKNYMQSLTAQLSFRDSIMFNNLQNKLKNNQNWKNVILSVSSLHSINNYADKKEFEKVISPIYNSLGNRLVNEYGEIVKQIAVVCYECSNNKSFFKQGFKNEFKKKSIEDYLAKRYEYAYVSLSDMRKNDEFKNYKFYFRPTFDSFIKSDWQQIFDGIIFLKNCRCN